MKPVIPSGSRVTVEPIDVERIELGDIVVAELDDSMMLLHLVRAIDRVRRRVEISGTSGPANGWTTLGQADGNCTWIGENAVPGAEAQPIGPWRRGRWFQQLRACAAR